MKICLARTSISDIRYSFLIVYFLSWAFPALTHAAPMTDDISADVSISRESSMQEGKALYESGQYMAALGEFMNVLHNDPTQPEARHYLTLVIDAMRKGPGGGMVVPVGSPVLMNAAAGDEIRRMLEKRSRLTLDIQAIPGVKIDINENTSEITVDTPQLFADAAGGLREQGVPMLDRIAAWLGTFGQQPVIIHCYPEELQESSSGGGSLFLHRYSELYNFFTQERKMPPQRFVSADLLVQQEAERAPTVGLSSSTAVVVFETVGSQTALLQAMPSPNTNHKLASWLEFSIFSSRARLFNPEEGEWAGLDLAALARNGVKSWTFTISPEGKKKTPVFTRSGAGNLLQRMSWDGRDQTSGSFVASGNYIAGLSATDSIGVQMNQQMTLHVQRGNADAAFVTSPSAKVKPKNARTHSAKAKPKSPAPRAAASESESLHTPASTTSAAAAAVAPVVGVPSNDDSDTLIGNTHTPTLAPVGNPAATAAPADSSSGDASHTIWKQVIQFDGGQSTLQAGVKTSLERIGKTLEVYPRQKVRIVGFAASSEPSAATLAKKRAETVRSILVDEYGVDQKRVILGGGKVSSNDGDTKVELSITN